MQTVPRTYRTQAEGLLSWLARNPKEVSWNHNGEVTIDGSALPGSSIADLVNDSLRLRKGFKPIGREPREAFAKTFAKINTNLVPRSRGWAKPKARSGQVRKFDFFDWLFQNMAVTALKFERALRGFSGPQGNSMSVFMQINIVHAIIIYAFLGHFVVYSRPQKLRRFFLSSS